jgi:hypothetical protein
MRLQTIIPGKLYKWGDHSPFLGIEHVSELDLESKRQTLFGRCDIDQFLTSEHSEAAIWFDTYLSIELQTKDANKIFLPTVFIKFCDDFKKHFGDDWSWSTQRTRAVACAMNKPRYFRLIASCWLANYRDQIDFDYTQNWDPEERVPGLYEILQIGGIKDWTGTGGPDLLQLPEHRIGPFDDIGIVDSFLALYENVYRRAASAVVIGAVCWEWASEICEKYLYAVYAGCIPLVQGYGVYDRLQALGFDTFDDIIDISSQWERNPIFAAWNLWERNKDFFANAKDIVSDPAVQRRLRSNLTLTQDLLRLKNNAINNLNDIASIEASHLQKIYELSNWYEFT